FKIKVLELMAAAFAHGLLERGIAIVGKKLEGIAFVVLLSHEDQGRMRREQQQRGGEHAGAAGNQAGEALALCAIADLVVVLQADHVRGRGNPGAQSAARTPFPELERLALEDKTLL